MDARWYEHAYRRLLLDMHVPGWDTRFMAQYDPERFIAAVRSANAGAVTLFANTHTGMANYQSKVGPAHPAFAGRDVFEEAVSHCRRHRLSVTCYYCVNYVDWYWDTHPEARTVDAAGRSLKLAMPLPGQPRRFSVCCMNDPGYQAFVAAQLTELCSGYDFDAVTIDMTFWSTVCYCHACRARYAREVGGEPPKIINWTDPRWVGFQRRRQAWLVDFMRMCRRTIAAHKPGIPVTHQSLQYTSDWVAGGSVELAAESDWLSADIYRDKDALSFCFNLFKHLSSTLPFEAISTWCYPNIFEHVITRTPEELRVTAFRPFAHRGSTVFIDAVDPLGQVAEGTYSKVAPVYADLARLEQYAVGRPCEDIAIYLSFDANVDHAENGTPVDHIFQPEPSPISPSAHRTAALQAAQTLAQHHLPFAVITARDLEHLDRYQVLLLANVTMLGAAEIAAFRAFVAAGGGLYASKATGILDSDGHVRADFGLADVLGVSRCGETAEIVSYLSPTEEGAGIFDEFSPHHPFTLPDSQMLVQASDGATVLATITLPYTDPTETRYASILTNPPGRPTAYPALVAHRHGAGRAAYAAGTPEIGEHDSQRAVFANLIRSLAARPLSFEMTAPKCVELTLYYDEDGQRYLINVLNVQRELPNIPVNGIRARIRLDGHTPASLVTLPDREPIAWTVEDDSVLFVAPTLETFLLLELACARHPADPATPT